jgi:hypothetical protein
LVVCVSVCVCVCVFGTVEGPVSIIIIIIIPSQCSGLVDYLGGVFRDSD